MSRSNPTEHGSKNPSARWFEWQGEQGIVRYYDKERGENITAPLPFTFLLLDQLASVRGWSDASSSGIYSNEVKDTRQELLTVKSFKGGVIAEGLYADIKDRVNRAGGQFVANCYIGFKIDGVLSIGALRFKGAALGAWMEFGKTHRADLYEKAITITGYDEGKKGRIVYRTPTFKLTELSGDSHAQAVALDKTLQAFLREYLSHNKTDTAAAAVRHERIGPPDYQPEDYDNDEARVPDEDPIPF